jgi:TonB family protein
MIPVHAHRWLAGVLAAALAGPAALLAPQPTRPETQTPLPNGQRIVARDGDTIVVENGARIRIVRRSDANVRAIFNAAQGWLVLLVDSATPDGGAPDGRVDTTYTFNDVTGEWPLGSRWEGAAVVEDYSIAGGLAQGVGMSTPNGLLQLLSPRGGEAFRDPAAVAQLSFGGAGRGGGGGESFAQAEERQVAVAIRNVARVAPPGSSLTMGLSVSGGGSAVRTESSSSDAMQAPVRVGGNIATPRKITDAAPVMPDTARQAGVTGIVILEITIGTDGAVRDAKVLRSIPLLDAAAVDAVRQWRYEPTLLQGTPVPVIMTVTVNFR